ncbi:hypothetical protein GQ54DRAFT_23693 [Martensiomyces pterosporus]|nr:hypothetical protein GQ54DRAFT_23693 [Martensiomyces pterosporus]
MGGSRRAGQRAKLKRIRYVHGGNCLKKKTLAATMHEPQHSRTQEQQGKRGGSENPGSMSPRSRRRYQSKLSSARLRERQRKRIADTEKDIERLESHIQTLQDMIKAHKQRQASAIPPCLDTSSERNARQKEVGQQQQQQESVKAIMVQLAKKIDEHGDEETSELVSALGGRLEWLESTIQKVQVVIQAIAERAAALGLPVAATTTTTTAVDEARVQDDLLDNSRISISFLTGTPGSYELPQ